MKNKFLLIVFVVMLGVISTSKAIELKDIDIIDWDIVQRRVICCESAEDKIEKTVLENAGKEIQMELIGALKCEKCDFESSVQYKCKIGHKFAFREETLKFEYGYEHKVGGWIWNGTCDGNTFVECNIAHQGYKKYTINEIDFYVDWNAIKQKLSDGKRWMFSVDKTNNETCLYLIGFAPNEIDLYSEKSLVKVDTYGFEKYGIYPVFNDVAGNIPKSVTRIAPNEGNTYKEYDGERIFFACAKKEHSLCKAEGCNNFVASKGKNADLDRGKFLNAYCAQDHACGFFWKAEWTLQDGSKFVENLECLGKESMHGGMRTGTMLFCKSHICLDASCTKPIIGVSMVYEKSDNSSLYSGSDRLYYSNCCESHMCLYYRCRDIRLSTDSTGGEANDNKEVTGIPCFCRNHSICAVPGCGKMIKFDTYNSTDSSVKKHFCEEHNKNMYNDIATEVEDCKSCGVSFQKAEAMKPVNDITSNYLFCQACLEKIMNEGGASICIENGEIKDMSAGEMGLSEVRKTNSGTCYWCGETKRNCIKIKERTLCLDCADLVIAGKIKVPGDDGKNIPVSGESDGIITIVTNRKAEVEEGLEDVTTSSIDKLKAVLNEVVKALEDGRIKDAKAKVAAAEADYPTKMLVKMMGEMVKVKTQEDSSVEMTTNEGDTAVEASNSAEENTESTEGPTDQGDENVVNWDTIDWNSVEIDISVN